MIGQGLAILQIVDKCEIGILPNVLLTLEETGGKGMMLSVRSKAKR